MTTNKHCVLVVDDEDGIRELLCEFLEDAGYETLQAANGRDAYDIVSSKSVDAVISDIRMPGGSGIELLERLGARPQRMPIVMLVTGFTDLAKDDAYNKGASAFFSKPFNPDEIIETVRHQLLPCAERWAVSGEIVAADHEVTIEIGALTAAKGRLVGVGRGGIFIRLEGAPSAEFAEGNVVNFAISVKESNQQICGQGTVRWYNDRAAGHVALGIEFAELSMDSIALFCEIIKTANPLAYIPRE